MALHKSKSKKKFMKGAVKRPGAFKKKAKRAGKSVTQEAHSVLKKGSKASTRTKKQANLALIFKRFRPRKRAS